jgi:DNA-binding Lrp family transcriptional regulator
MQKAFILINAEPGKLWKIADSIMKVAGVKIASAVTGAYDVIVYAEIVDMSALGALINVIHSMDGVERTQTAIEIPPRVE